MKTRAVFLWMLGACLCTQAGFFNSDSDRGAALPADKVYPLGRIFPISGFSPPAGTNLRKLGYSLAGPVYGGNERMKDFARIQAKSNMPVIWQLEVVYKGRPMSIQRFDEMNKAKENIDWPLMEQAMTASVQEALETADNQIVYWALTPEELRSWRGNEMEYLKRFTTIIRKLDGQKRPIWMYHPGHRDQSGLEPYTPYLDVMAQGYYPRAGKTPRVWGRFHAENLQNAAAKSGNKNIIVGIVPEMFVQPTEAQMELIPVWVRHDVYVSLIYGGKFVVIFSLARRANFDAHGEYFFAYSQLARTLTKPGGIGEVLLFGEPQNALKLTVAEGEKEVVYRRLDKAGKVIFEKSYPTLASRELLHTSGRYLLIANSSEQPVQAVLSGLPAVPVTVVDAESDREIANTDQGKLDLNFTPYEVKVLRFAPQK